ncbi:hypothetical protein V7O61_00130 [Methanolobus sp. WCC1]|jgi:hypothetical protein|uniref:hypothetical protein n=1 Tax=unclassified Methanolobus TaxID=2629569 RepID=UPI003254033A
MEAKSKHIAIVIIILIISIAFIAAISGKTGNAELYYTDKELQTLYEKYDITENDIKFAKGELPNYLEGTILYNSSKIVIANEDGIPDENMVQGVDYDIIISEKEMFDIIENARSDYIKKYGVDPDNPKLDSVDGYLLPVQEANRLVFQQNIRELLA